MLAFLEAHLEPAQSPLAQGIALCVAPRRQVRGALRIELWNPADIARAVLRLVARHRTGRRVPTRQLLGATAHLADVANRLAPELALRIAARRLSR